MHGLGRIAAALLLLSTGTAAQERPSGATTAADPVGVVSHVKVLSDKVLDVSSLEAWKRSYIKDGMTDEQKALAIWKSVVAHQHQESPPYEDLQASGQVQDAMKIFNVYGYSMCSPASADICQLARYLGLKARGWGINGHSVPEVFYDGAWHLLDASLICYFPKADGKIASVEEIQAAVAEWYAKNPGMKGDDAKLRKYHQEGGWQGWKRGPDLIQRSPTLDGTGWWPAKTHGWYATMQEYDGSGGGSDGKAFLYEYGYTQGYQVNIQLRPGERLTRNWSNKGLHVNMKSGGAPGCIDGATGSGSLRYTPEYGDLAPGRIGNGVHEYEVPLRGGFRSGALVAENLGDDARVVDPSKPGVLVVRMPSSYVYLGGRLELDSTGEAAVSFSDNNGLDWKEIARGSGAQEIDLKPHCFRRYDYRLKVELRGSGTGLTKMRMSHDIQHSQRPLPALDKGANTLTFSAGPSEGTITLEGNTDPSVRGKQLTYRDFHPEVAGLKDPRLLVQGKGEVTFPVRTPGDLLRIRMGAHFRARDARDGWDYLVSFDKGATWKTAGRASGPTAGDCAYVTFADVPAGTREALVRFAGTSRNTTLIHDLRIDADYREPRGGFRPVKVTYAWTENGQEQKNVFVAKKPQETYTITCAEKPVMKSIVLELAE
jgi:hypothetical protein